MKKLLLALSLFFVLAANGQVNTTSLLDTSYNHAGYWINKLNISQTIQCEDVRNDGVYAGVYIESKLQGRDSYIIKRKPDGSIDTAFGNAGIVTISPHDFLAYVDSTPSFYAKDIKILPDNKIVLLGGIAFPIDQSTSFGKIVVCKFCADGSWDTTFANNGIYVTDYQNNLSFSAQKLVVCINGKVLAMGNIGNYLNKKRTIFRLNADGILDTTFNYVGYRNFSNIYTITFFENLNSDIIIPFWSNLNGGNFRSLVMSPTGDSLAADISSPSISNYISNIFMDKQGRLYYCGYDTEVGGDDLYIYRTKPDFQFDTDFGVNGLLTIAIPYYDIIRHNLNFSNDAIYSATIAHKTHSISPDSLYSESYVLNTKLNLDGSTNNDFGLNGQYYLSLPYRIDYNAEPYCYPIIDGVIVTGSQQIFNADSLQNFYNFFAAKLRNDTVSIILDVIDNPTITQPILAYPNPIQNSTINLSYVLTNKQDVSVDLYNLQGQLIASLVTKQPRQKGNNTEVLSLPKGLASGQYIVRVVAGEYQKGIKVLVQ